MQVGAIDGVVAYVDLTGRKVVKVIDEIELPLPTERGEWDAAPHAVPARTDLTDEEKGKFSEYQRSAMESFAKDKIVSSIAHGAALPSKATNAMNDALTKFAQGASDVAALQADLKAAAAS